MKKENKDWEIEEKHYKHHHGMFWGVVFLIAGLVFLLNNFGLLSWSVWSILWRFWPLIVIFWGLEILFSSDLAEVLITVVALIVLGFILIEILAFNNSSFRNWVQMKFPWLPVNNQMFQIAPRLRVLPRIPSRDLAPQNQL